MDEHETERTIDESERAESQPAGGAAPLGDGGGGDGGDADAGADTGTDAGDDAIDDEEEEETLASVLAEVIETEGETADDLDSDAGLDAGTVAAILDGSDACPTIEALVAIEESLGEGYSGVLVAQALADGCAYGAGTMEEEEETEQETEEETPSEEERGGGPITGERREIGGLVPRDHLTTRSARIASTVDEKARTVRATLATEQPVRVFDWWRGEAIDEILSVEGMVARSEVPLLSNHSRWSLDDVYGRVREIEVERPDGRAAEVAGLLDFADVGDDAIERAWAKVRGGYLSDVSVGYEVVESVRIRAGQTKEVGGTTYTAEPETDLRVATKWRLSEASIVPIGADDAAKIRRAARAARPRAVARSRRNAPSVGASRDSKKGARTVDPKPTTETKPTPEESAAREKERILAIRSISREHDLGADFEEKCVAEDLTIEETRAAALDAIRDKRAKPVEKPGGGPAIHSGDRMKGVRALTLAAGVLASFGNDPGNWRIGRQGRGVLASTDERDRWLEAFNQADERHVREMTALDLARACLAIDGARVPHGIEETLRAAFSTPSLNSVLSEVVNKTMMRGYVEAGDSTLRWTTTTEVPNFKTIQATRLADSSDLQILPPGGTAAHAHIDDDSETYRAYRFARKLAIDEQHFIDDDLSILDRLPLRFGAAAARVRPDLVYYIIQASAALADGVALFHATHGNLAAVAFSADNLQARIIAMAKQTDQNGAVLNLAPATLLVPPDLKFTAETVLASQERRGTAGAALDGTANPLQSADIEIVSENRLGVAGCTDPITGTALAGTATNWFTVASTAQAPTIEVAYLRGMGRAPRVRSYELSEGSYGRGWDINLDIGAKALDHRGMDQGNG